jgi:hypothetical protein
MERERPDPPVDRRRRTRFPAVPVAISGEDRGVFSAGQGWAFR